jgi:hypothetical protein
MKLFNRNWGQWTDLSTTGYMGNKYVLQARRHKNGQLQYRVEKSEDSYTCAIPTLEQLEKVTFKQQEQ